MSVDRSSFETTLDAARDPHVGLWRDEATEPWSAFYRWEVPPLPARVRSAIAAGLLPSGGTGLTDLRDLRAPSCGTPRPIASRRRGSTSGYGTVISATVDDADHGTRLARLVHAVRHTAEGSEMRSRFLFPSSTPDLIGPPMIDHCVTEMAHLASFLPRLHSSVVPA